MNKFNNVYIRNMYVQIKIILVLILQKKINVTIHSIVNGLMI